MSKQITQMQIAKVRAIRMQYEPVELFSEVLTVILNRSSKSSKEIAEAAHIRPATLSQWKHGKRLPSVDILLPLVKVLEIEPYMQVALLAALREHHALVNVTRLLVTIEATLSRMLEDCSIRSNSASWFENQMEVVSSLLKTHEASLHDIGHALEKHVSHRKYASIGNGNTLGSALSGESLKPP